MQKYTRDNKFLWISVSWVTRRCNTHKENANYKIGNSFYFFREYSFINNELCYTYAPFYGFLCEAFCLIILRIRYGASCLAHWSTATLQWEYSRSMQAVAFGSASPSHLLSFKKKYILRIRYDIFSATHNILRTNLENNSAQ